MPEVRVRPKHQITLPVSIVRAAGIALDDRLKVSYANGSIILTPHASGEKSADLMNFAGIGRGLWGATPGEMEQNLGKLRNEWER